MVNRDSLMHRPHADALTFNDELMHKLNIQYVASSHTNNAYAYCSSLCNYEIHTENSQVEALVIVRDENRIHKIEFSLPVLRK